MSKKRRSKSIQGQSQTKPIPNEVKGVSLLAFAFCLFLSALSFAYGPDTRNWLGIVGHSIGWLVHALFGLTSYLICLALSWVGWRLLFSKSINHPVLKSVFLCLLVFSTCMLLSLIEHRFTGVSTILREAFYPHLLKQKIRLHLGGALSFYLYHDLPFFNLAHIFNTLGVALIFSSLLLSSILFLLKISPSQIIIAIRRLLNAFKVEVQEQSQKSQAAQPEGGEGGFFRFVKLRIPGMATPGAPAAASSTTATPSQEMLAIKPETNLKERPSLSRKELTEQFDGGFSKTKKKEIEEGITVFTPPPKIKPKEVEKPPLLRTKREAALIAQNVHNGDFSNFSLPSHDLISNPKRVDQSTLKKDLRKQAEVLEETLSSFGIEAKVGQINCGPTITSFEVHPAIGVKVQKIRTLEHDIALNMEAKSIRIIAPIPGKAAVGIEVPNSQPQEVGFKDMLQAYQQGAKKFHIPILLGKAVNGEYVMSDLTKMPHCIIAGATGSGKSVCINTIVMSILMTAKPDEIKMIMVDPKKVELTPYTKLPHMLAPVITEPQGACAALNWLVKEMERRYEILKQIGVRNIDAFNNRTINKELEKSLGIEIPERIPYIVGIIDELADLMMVASNDIETPIARIAQMARAVGIHLILATQRPSREVITGLIKANFPTRISFKVASRVNSQIVLDETGAETLLGNGDMLFLPPAASHLVRAQGAFIRDEDINAVVKHICSQAPPNYVIDSFDRLGMMEDSGHANAEKNTGDALFDQAQEIVLQAGNASTTFLQRKLKIGYARAASLIDELESRGVIGPADGGKPRKLLLSAKQSSGERGKMGGLVLPEGEEDHHGDGDEPEARDQEEDETDEKDV
jgi:S-DNA-T family DNA segregation ATPase FtsK/SpoIIIE